jgi:hypothetical protein
MKLKKKHSITKKFKNQILKKKGWVILDWRAELIRKTNFTKELKEKTSKR